MNAPAAARPALGPGKAAVPAAEERPIPLKWLVLRVLWVTIELTLAYWLAWQAQPFFYQRF